MWDEEDTFGRWVQGLCAIPLLAWTFFILYLVAIDSPMVQSYGKGVGGSSGIVSAYIAYRCLRYAITGRNNINRDDCD